MILEQNSIEYWNKRLNSSSLLACFMVNRKYKYFDLRLSVFYAYCFCFSLFVFVTLLPYEFSETPMCAPLRKYKTPCGTSAACMKRFYFLI